MQRAILIAEILSSIIAFAELPDAARCARVCRFWLDISLDHVWAELQGLRPLFEILAPLVPKGENEPLVSFNSLTG